MKTKETSKVNAEVLSWVFYASKGITDNSDLMRVNMLMNKVIINHDLGLPVDSINNSLEYRTCINDIPKEMLSIQYLQSIYDWIDGNENKTDYMAWWDSLTEEIRFYLKTTYINNNHMNFDEFSEVSIRLIFENKNRPDHMKWWSSMDWFTKSEIVANYKKSNNIKVSGDPTDDQILDIHTYYMNSLKPRIQYTSFDEEKFNSYINKFSEEDKIKALGCILKIVNI